ncbi:hypothetical protein [Caviibacterium pharyngocola]|uniref:hypothetical protein n=1 Tax=Caviibacterium pharyngocola TaxID=28159 RepID=UPI00105551B0|nr:hypothetical protein [Caviibacterium pharyngocola]
MAKIEGKFMHNTTPQAQLMQPQLTPVLTDNLSDEQVFLMQIINGEIELLDNDEVLAGLKQTLEL